MLAEERVDLADAKNRLITVAPGDDDNLVQNIVLDLRIRNNPADELQIEEIP